MNNTGSLVIIVCQAYVKKLLEYSCAIIFAWEPYKLTKKLPKVTRLWRVTEIYGQTDRRVTENSWRVTDLFHVWHVTQGCHWSRKVREIHDEGKVRELRILKRS